MNQTRDVVKQEVPEEIQQILEEILKKRRLPLKGNYAILHSGLFGISFGDSINDIWVQMSVMSEFLKAIQGVTKES